MVAARANNERSTRKRNHKPRAARRAARLAEERDGFVYLSLNLGKNVSGRPGVMPPLDTEIAAVVV
jgi:hypothetical protein